MTAIGPATRAIRVLVVDDHPVVRDGLVAMLSVEADLSIAGEAADGLTAVRLYAELQPDVVLLDLRMPGMGGVAALTAIRRDFPQARAIVLTTFDTDEEIGEAFHAGARAYLLKDVPRRELVETIRSVHAGKRSIPPALALRLAERVAAPDLTGRQMEVLRLIVKGLSNREIGEELGLTEGTVKGYVNALLGRLGVRDRTQAATAAIRRGLAQLE